VTVGAIIGADTFLQPEAIPGRMGPLEAMRVALAAYLASATFRTHGGDDPRDQEWQLRAVRQDWPPPDTELDYPCASIVPVPATDDSVGPLTPHPLEDTLGLFDSWVGAPDGSEATCLWRTGDAVATLQVDFWADREADRQAIEGALPALFAPNQRGNCLTVEGPELYFGQPCEYTLLSHHPDDSGLTAYRNERRLRCMVRARCAIVALRRATVMLTPTATVTVTNPADPGEE
jgi:hypothetical protein